MRTFGSIATAGYLQSAATNSEPKILQCIAFFRNVADQEALEGRISYYPASRAIPFSYFPYLVNMISVWSG